MERTLILIKPDAFQRGLVGGIIGRLEQKGLKVVATKMLQMTDEILDDHYSHLVKLPFFPEIKGFMSSGPVFAMSWEGMDAVAVVRRLCGVTNSREAAPGTIRGDFGISIQCNLIHASEDLAAAEKELKTFFADEDFFSYDLHNMPVLYSDGERG